MSAASLEKLREKMRAAAAQIKQLKKEEKKAKKKEYDLMKILLQFVKTSNKKDLTLLISRVLEINVPANFVLTMILLGNKEIQEAVGKFLMLEQPEGESDEKTLTIFNEDDETLPLKVKIQLDRWVCDLLSQAEEVPQKLLKTAYKVDFDDTKYEEKKSIQPPLIQLMSFVVREFLEQHKITESFTKLRDFSEFVLKGILIKTKEALDNRKMLDE